MTSSGTPGREHDPPQAPTAATTAAPASAPHSHSHSHSHTGREPITRTVALVFGANTVLLVAQLIGGLVAGSLALVGDSAHQATDVVSLAMVLVGIRLRRRPADRIHSFGRRRTDAVVAQISAVMLVAASTWIVIEAVSRIEDPHPIEGTLVVVLAMVGLIINGGGAWILHRDGSTSLLSRSAVAHLLADAAGSVGVLVVGLTVTLTDWTAIDPIVSILLALAIGHGAIRLARDATRLLLDAAPTELDLDEIAAAITDRPDVEAVHHLHLWRIDDYDIALSSHLVIASSVPGVSPTIHDSQEIVQSVSAELLHRFGITHATMQVECHPCEQPVHP